jgi:hypothetical protein|tara:strand:+ start:413 stop:565 length:153 start_codon:yes stop_codon:yes gene_type:complete
MLSKDHNYPYKMVSLASKQMTKLILELGQIVLNINKPTFGVKKVEKYKMF